jgi:hypothetical protein
MDAQLRVLLLNLAIITCSAWLWQVGQGRETGARCVVLFSAAGFACQSCRFLVDNFVGSRPIMCLAGWLDLPFVMEIIKWTDVDVQTGGASFGYKHGALAAGSTLYVSSTCYMENAFCIMIMLVFQLCVKLAK